VKVELRQPSDGATSEPLDFEMLPLKTNQKLEIAEESVKIRAFKLKISIIQFHCFKFIPSLAWGLEFNQEPFKTVKKEPCTSAYPEQTTLSPQPMPRTSVFMTQNNFQQQNQFNQIYTPDIPFSSESNAVWTSTMNVLPSISTFFHQPLIPLVPNVTPNADLSQINFSNEMMSSSRILQDFDSEVLNLSGNLNNLSFADEIMKSFNEPFLKPDGGQKD
jgi:hypothetical protein